MITDKDHLIFGGFRTHSISTINGRLLYEEKNLGPESEVPYFLIPDKESNEVVQEITTKLEQDLRDCREQPLQTTILGKDVSIKCNIKHTQFDRSLIQKVSKLGGAICNLCPATRHGLFYIIDDDY